MTLAKVLAEHWQCVNDHHNAAANRPHCFACKEPWPCDAVEMARQLQEAQERDVELRAAGEAILPENLSKLGSVVDEYTPHAIAILIAKADAWVRFRAALAQPVSHDR